MAEGSTARNPTITVGGVTCVCVIGENSDDQSFMGGGIGNQGQMTVQTVLADWGATIPEKPQTATLAGLALGNGLVAQVISTTERNGILYIIIGDNSTQ